MGKADREQRPIMGKPSVAFVTCLLFLHAIGPVFGVEPAASDLEFFEK